MDLTNDYGGIMATSSMVILSPTPDYLSSFTFNRDKVEYFEKASKLVEKLHNS